jgi:hypothetical protein
MSLEELNQGRIELLVKRDTVEAASVGAAFGQCDCQITSLASMEV